MLLERSGLGCRSSQEVDRIGRRGDKGATARSAPDVLPQQDEFAGARFRARSKRVDSQPPSCPATLCDRQEHSAASGGMAMASNMRASGSLMECSCAVGQRRTLVDTAVTPASPSGLLPDVLLSGAAPVEYACRRTTRSGGTMLGATRPSTVLESGRALEGRKDACASKVTPTGRTRGARALTRGTTGGVHRCLPQHRVERGAEGGPSVWIAGST